MRLRISQILFTLAVTSVAAFALSSQMGSDFYVELSRGSCFGNCPSYVLSIDGAGKVVYRGTRENKFDYGDGVGSISIKQVDELRQEITKASFFDVPTPSCDEKIDDESDFWLFVKDGKDERQVYRHHGCSYTEPDSVVELARFIDDLTNSSRWHKSSK